jgi:hypothetical protein
MFLYRYQRYRSRLKICHYGVVVMKRKSFDAAMSIRLALVLEFMQFCRIPPKKTCRRHEHPCFESPKP